MNGGARLFFLVLLLAAACGGHDEVRVPAHQGLRDQRRPWQPDLCRAGTVVVVGVVEDRESSWSLTEYGKRVETKVAIWISHAIAGDVDEGSLRILMVEGGTVDGVSGRVSGVPALDVGACYFLALRDLSQDGRSSIIHWRGIPPDRSVHLPAQEDMRSVWLATCEANPQGVHPDSQFDWVFPYDVSRRGFKLLGWATRSQ